MCVRRSGAVVRRAGWCTGQARLRSTARAVGSTGGGRARETPDGLCSCRRRLGRTDEPLSRYHSQPRFCGFRSRLRSSQSPSPRAHPPAPRCGVHASLRMPSILQPPSSKRGGPGTPRGSLLRFARRARSRRPGSYWRRGRTPATETGRASVESSRQLCGSTTKATAKAGRCWGVRSRRRGSGGAPRRRTPGGSRRQTPLSTTESSSRLGARGALRASWIGTLPSSNWACSLRATPRWRRGRRWGRPTKWRLPETWS